VEGAVAWVFENLEQGDVIDAGVDDGQEPCYSGGAAGGVNENGSTQREIVNSLVMMGIGPEEAEMVRYYYVMCAFLLQLLMVNYNNYIMMGYFDFWLQAVSQVEVKTVEDAVEWVYGVWNRDQDGGMSDAGDAEREEGHRTSECKDEDAGGVDDDAGEESHMSSELKDEDEEGGWSSDEDFVVQPPNVSRRRDAPAKGQKLTTKSNSRAGGISSSSTTTPVPTKDTREDCRYGSKCFRRNEVHLLRFRHDLCE